VDVNAGSETNEQLVRFQDKILIKLKSYSAVANDSLPISISVKNNNYEPTSLLILLLSVKIQPIR
jgi:hypothetical protein